MNDDAVSHRHLRHIVEVVVDRPKDVHALQTRVSRVYHDRLLTVVDEVMTQASRAGETIVLDRLEVETEPVALDHLESEWPEKLRRALERALDNLNPPTSRIADAAADSRSRRLDPEFDALTFLLDRGYAAWWAPPHPSSFLDAQLSDVLDRRPSDVATAVRHRIYREAVRRRLATQLSDVTLRRLVTVLAPRESAFLLAAWSSVRSAIGERMERPPFGLAERLLIAAAGPSDADATRASFVADLLSVAARHIGVRPERLRQQWADQLVQNQLDKNQLDEDESAASAAEPATILLALDEAATSTGAAVGDTTPSAGAPTADRILDWFEYVWRFGSAPAGGDLGRITPDATARAIDAAPLRARLRRAPRDRDAGPRLSRPGARVTAHQLVKALEPAHSVDVFTILDAFRAAHHRFAAGSVSDFETDLWEAALVHLVEERRATFSRRAFATSLLRLLRARHGQSVPERLEGVVEVPSSVSRGARAVKNEGSNAKPVDQLTALEARVEQWLAAASGARDPAAFNTNALTASPSDGLGEDHKGPTAGPDITADAAHAREADRAERRGEAEPSAGVAARRQFDRGPERVIRLIRRTVVSAEDLAWLSSVLPRNLLAAVLGHLMPPDARHAPGDMREPNTERDGVGEADQTPPLAGAADATHSERTTTELRGGRDPGAPPERPTPAEPVDALTGLEARVQQWFVSEGGPRRRDRTELSGPVAARRLFTRDPERLIALIRRTDNPAHVAAVIAGDLSDDLLEAIVRRLAPALSALLIDIAGRLRTDSGVPSFTAATWESVLAVTLAPNVSTSTLDEILSDMLTRLAASHSRSASALAAQARAWIETTHGDEAAATRARVVADSWTQAAARAAHRQLPTRRRHPGEAEANRASRGIGELALDVATANLIASAAGVAPLERAALIAVVHAFQELDRIAPPSATWPAAWRSLVRRWTRAYLAERRAAGVTAEDLVTMLAARASDAAQLAPAVWREWLETAVARSGADPALRARMADAVRAGFPESRTVSIASKPSASPTADRILFGIDALLRHGALPLRLGVGERENPPALLRWASRHEPERLARIIRGTHVPAITARLLAQWSSVDTRLPTRLVSVLAPAIGPPLQSAAALRSVPIAGDQTLWSRVVFEHLFRVVLEQTASVEDLASGVVEQWASETGTSKVAACAAIHEALSAASQRSKHLELAGVLARLKRRFELDAATPKGVKARREPDTRTQPQTQTQLDTQRGALPIQNAGLVLLWGFLPQYFRLTRVLDEDGQFVDRSARERAVHLVEMLATGAQETPEPLLALNKVLCGMPIEDPVPRGIVASEDDRAHARALLAAAIHHWTTVRGRVSIGGFQESFLRRRGWLSREKDQWRVTVEPRGIDVLLDSLPWSIAVVKTAWMPEPLTVSWR